MGIICIFPKLLLGLILQARVANVVPPFANPCKDGENPWTAFECPLSFQVVFWPAATWTRKGMDRLWRKRRWERGRSASQRKRKKGRGRRANLHTLGAVKMSVEIEWRRRCGVVSATSSNPFAYAATKHPLTKCLVHFS